MLFRSTTVRHLESEFARIVEKRAQYNRGRYPDPVRGLGAERDFPLPDTERRLWLEMSTSPDPYPVHPDGCDTRRLGPADPGREQGHDLATGSGRTQNGQSRLGEEHRGLAPNLGNRAQWTIFDSNAAPHVETRLDIQQSSGLEAGVSHDRTGTHSEKYPAHSGTRLDRNPADAQRFPDQPPTQPGEPRPGHPTATGANRATPDRASRISAALATLERYTRELGTALVALERLVERQIERLRERELEREREQQRQRSRGPGLGR